MLNRQLFNICRYLQNCRLRVHNFLTSNCHILASSTIFDNFLEKAARFCTVRHDLIRQSPINLVEMTKIFGVKSCKNLSFKNGIGLNLHLVSFPHWTYLDDFLIWSILIDFLKYSGAVLVFLCDWSIKITPLFYPIRCKSASSQFQLGHPFSARALGMSRAFTLSSYWFVLMLTFCLFNFVFVIRHFFGMLTIDLFWNISQMILIFFLLMFASFQETEGPKIAGETLLVRGEELPKFLNSL